MIPVTPVIFSLSMLRYFYTTAILLLAGAVFFGLPGEARGNYVEKHGKTLAKRSAARKRGNYKLSRKTTALLATKSAARAKVRSRVAVRSLASRGKASERNVSSVFGKEKGHLPWPVDSRKVSMHFGLQTYMDNVKIDNLGIVIEAGKDADVKAVLDGVVDDVMDIGEGVAVLIKHENYFFIYSDLSKAAVVRGQKVCAGEVLGKVGEMGQLDFRLYDAGDIWLDPEKWLVR